MAKIKTIFPPNVPSFLPAFDKDTENPKFYFKPAITNTIEQIVGLHVSVRRQDTNRSVLNGNDFPFDMIFVDKSESMNVDDGELYKIKYDSKKKYYYFRFNHDLFETPDVAYKVQIRAVSNGISSPRPGLTSDISSWLQNNLDNFSEWSIVTIMMPLTVPKFGLTGMSEEEENDINSSGYNFVGYYEPQDRNKKETLSTYRLNIYEYKDYDDMSTWTLYASSRERTIGIYEQVNIEEVFNRDLEQDKKYVITFTIKTKNLYSKTKYYKIVGAYPTIEMFNTIILEPDEEEGRVNIKIQAKQILMKPTEGTKVSYTADDPAIGSVPNIRNSHAKIEGTVTTNKNFSMNAEEDKWVLQTKVKIDKIYSSIKEAYANPFIIMENDLRESTGSNLATKIKLSCLVIDLNGGYYLMDSSGTVSQQSPDVEYRIIARKELVLKGEDKDTVLLSQNKVFRTKEAIDKKQEYYIYLKEEDGLMELDVKKTYKSRN